MEFVILGPTTLHVDGERVDLGTAKQRGLFAVLLYHVGDPVRTSVLAEHLWPGQVPDNWRTSLYSLVSRARAVLNHVGLPKALVRTAGTAAYCLNIDPDTVDYHRFRGMTERAREVAHQGRHDVATELLTEAIGLWRHEPLADLRGVPAEHVRMHMNHVLLTAHKVLASSKLQTEQFASVLAQLDDLVRHHDLDEILAQQWITALCATGREAEARSFLTNFRRRFRKEMHAEPSLELTLPQRHVASVREVPLTVVPTTPAAGPRQLPGDITDFTGHQSLLDEIDRLTDRAGAGTNTVVLSGMPGAGKTTLAIHWAHRQKHRFPDGQLYLNAGAYGPTPPVDPGEALGRFLHAFEIPPDRIPPGSEQRRDRLNQLLADRRVLIVLDNVQDSGQVRPLLPTSDTCLTVITSRNRLRGLTVREGVRNLTVPPLPEDGCLDLLTRIIGRSRATDEPSAVAALARLSGGLPLAVRIIAEHVAARPRARIAELVDELNAHVLDCEGEDDDEGTLRTVFAWSHHALRPDAARMFRLSGLHPGGSLGADAAAVLAGTDPYQAEQLLNGLAKAHLVNHDTARRYRFHDLLRRYAADRADREEPRHEREEAMRRLLDWYLLSASNAAAALAPLESPVPDLPTPADVRPRTFACEAEAMTWCDAERGNLGAVARWAAGNGFHRYGWQIPGAIHEIFDRYGSQDDVRELQETALWAAQVDGHLLGQIGTLNNLAATHFARHDYRQAAASFAAALDLARGTGHLEAQTICSHNLAAVHLATGHTGMAVGIYHEVLSTWRDLGNPAGEAATLHRLGDAHRLMKRYAEAVAYYGEALTIREQVGSLRGQGVTHGELAALYLETGRWECALEHCRQALSIHDQTRDDVARCDVLTTMADVERELMMSRDAIRLARRAVAISEEIADSVRHCRALTVLAHALAVAGHARSAGQLCGEALTLVGELADPAAGALRDRLLTLRSRLSTAAG